MADVVKVDFEKKDDESYVFIQDGDYCLGAAQFLFESSDAHPFFMFPAATLCHHGIELILKGCLIWEKSEYPEIHKLLDIANQISFLTLTDEYSNLLEKIDTFYFFRYPMDKMDSDRIEKLLVKIDDNICGIQRLPGEIGTEDWIIVGNFHKYLMELMPNELLSIYNKIGTTVK